MGGLPGVHVFEMNFVKRVGVVIIGTGDNCTGIDRDVEMMGYEARGLFVLFANNGPIAMIGVKGDCHGCSVP